jgi:hypothetical protein
MSGEVFDIGDQVRWATVFRNVSAVATDPTTVKAKIRTPGGTETEYVYGVDAAVVRTGVGAYYVDVTFTESSSSARPWSLRWVASGNLVTAEERHIRVRTTNFADPL